MIDIMAASSGRAVDERDMANLRHLSKAILLRVDPAVIGLVCRRGGPRPGEDWFEASRALAKVERPYDLLPKLIRAVGEAGPELAIYRCRLAAAPTAEDVLDRRRTMSTGSATIHGEAAALAYGLADRALQTKDKRAFAFEAFAAAVERDMPFQAGALAYYMASELIDLEELVVGVRGWAGMKDKLHAGLCRVAGGRSAA